MSNPIVHIEFQVSDPKKAAEWYDKLFGWKIQHFDEMDYSIFTPMEGILGGGFNKNRGQTAAVYAYILADDVTAMLKKIEAAGGTIIQEEFEAPGIAQFGFFQDPDGNALALMKPHNPIHYSAPTAETPLDQHAPVHIEFYVSDFEKAGKWYTDLFGWKVTHMPEIPYSTFTTGEGMVGGGFGVEGSMPTGTVPYFATDDLTATVKKARDLGATIVEEAMPIPGGKIAHIKDPDGNLFGLAVDD